MSDAKPVVLSGIQPQRAPHIGNYLGAIRSWVEMQSHYDCYFAAVDLHALTVTQDPKELYEGTLEGVAYYLACGLDPQKMTLFIQSHVAAHAELGWILTCSSYMGELSRMTQYKDKTQKQAHIGVGLFTYPALMAADILLYQPHFVPIGHDQKQHLELTRNLAERLNNRYKQQLFKTPEPFITKVAARVMDLQNPLSKMSKSAKNPKGVVFLDDTDKEITKKIKSAVTDSGSVVVDYSEASPGLKNLCETHGALSGKKPEEVAQEYKGRQYGYLKVDTAQLAVSVIAPIRSEAQKLQQDRGYLLSVLEAGAQKAAERSQITLDKVKKAFGLIVPGK